MARGPDRHQRIRRCKHGHAKARTPTYNSWADMMARCYTSTNPKFIRLYQERGITVCNRWHDFENFLSDMGTKPPKATLDRTDNDKGYDPENCRWATPKQQAQNTRRNVNLEHNGRILCVSEWARVIGWPRQTLVQRLKKLGSIDQVFEEYQIMKEEPNGSA